MNLLILPEYGYPCNHAVVNTVFETLLPARGHVVHMIRPMAGATQPGPVDASWSGGSLVVYPADQPGGMVARILSLFRRSRWLRKAVASFDNVPLDAILVRNDLPSALAAMRLAKRRRIPFVYQLSSPDAEFLIRLGHRTGGARGLYQRLRGRLDMAVRRSIMRRADAVLAISDAMRDHLVAADTLDPSRVFAFPMGVRDAEPPTPPDVDALRHRLGLTVGRTIVYSGVLDPVRESALMLDILDRVRADLPDTVLLVLTYQDQHDPRRQAFEREALQRGAAVKVVGPLSHAEAFGHLHGADVMLTPLPPVPEYNMSSPTKTLEGMYAALPIVGSEQVVEHAMVFGQSGAGIAVPWDEAAFAEAITALLRAPDVRRDMGARGRHWVRTHRTYTHLTAYLERILDGAGSLTRLAALPHQVEDRSS